MGGRVRDVWHMIVGWFDGRLSNALPHIQERMGPVIASKPLSVS